MSYRIFLEGPAYEDMKHSLETAFGERASVARLMRNADVLVYMDFKERLTDLERWLHRTKPFLATKTRLVCMPNLSLRSRRHLKDHPFHYLQLPSLDVFAIVGRILGELHVLNEETPEVPYLIGRSPGLLNVLKRLAQVAGVQDPILLEGESGTGKELLTQYVHEQRGQGELVAYNCAGLTAANVEEVLQGQGKAQGLYQLAAGGTCFLDEIGNMDDGGQANILRLIDNPNQSRLVFATGLNMKVALEDGSFRQELYHRISNCHIQIPPLRERSEDIPLLVNHIIDTFNAEQKSAIQRPLSYNPFYAYSWPGNIRQLQVVTRSALREMDGARDPLDEILIKNAITQAQEHIQGAENRDIPFYRGEDSWENLHDRALRIYLEDALNRYPGITPETLSLIGKGKTWVYKQVKKFEL